MDRYRLVDDPTPDVVGDPGSARVTILTLQREGLGANRFQGRGDGAVDFSGAGDAARGDELINLLQRRPLRGRPVGENLEQNRPQPIKIGALVDLVVLHGNLLGRHVRRCAHAPLSLVGCRVGSDRDRGVALSFLEPARLRH